MIPKSLDELTSRQRADLQLTDPILYAMLEDGVPITRQSYIEFNWGEPPDPWNAEHEAELPEELQDWSAFDGDA